MKRLLTLISALCITSLAFAQSDALPKMFAHRGCWSKICPENSLPAVARAKQHGYIGIECDVKMTADGKMVIMHDRTINRTCRNASDYSKIEGKINISDLTFKELRKNYVLASPNADFRMPVPTLKELLTECKRHNIVPMLHSKYVESYRLAQKIMGDDWVCFTKDVNALKECRKFSKCLILYAIDEKSAETAFEVLPQLGGRVGVSSMKREALTRERIAKFRSLGYEVQQSIYRAPREVFALRDGTTIILSDFALMPDPNNNPTKVLSVDAKALAQGETIAFSADKKVKDGGVAIDIEFEGVVEIAFDKNSNIYTLHNSGNYHDRFGMRFINQKGLVTIHGVEATKIKSAKIYFYEF